MADVTQESTGPRYPEVKVKLVGEDGNAYAIMGRVEAALKQAGVEKARTAMRWCTCDDDEEDIDWD